MDIQIVGIPDALARLKLTQRALARKAGVSSQHIWAVANGHKPPSLNVLMDIACALQSPLIIRMSGQDGSEHDFVLSPQDSPPPYPTGWVPNQIDGHPAMVGSCYVEEAEESAEQVQAVLTKLCHEIYKGELDMEEVSQLMEQVWDVYTAINCLVHMAREYGLEEGVKLGWERHFDKMIDQGMHDPDKVC